MALGVLTHASRMKSRQPLSNWTFLKRFRIMLRLTTGRRRSAVQKLQPCMHAASMHLTSFCSISSFAVSCCFAANFSIIIWSCRSDSMVSVIRALFYHCFFSPFNSDTSSSLQLRRAANIIYDKHDCIDLKQSSNRTYTWIKKGV